MKLLENKKGDIMSGIIGNFFEPKTRKLFSKIFSADMLGAQYGEYNIALLHILEGFSIQLSGILLAIHFSYWLLLPLMFLGCVKILIDEWPSEGRRIDVKSRGLGWFIGCVIGMVHGVFHIEWYFLTVRRDGQVLNAASVETEGTNFTHFQPQRTLKTI